MISEPRRRIGPWIGLLGVVALACSTHREGIELDLGAQHHPGGRDPGGVSTAYPAGQPRGSVTDLGYGVVLQKAYVTVERLEIVPCEGSFASLQRIWERLSPVSVARAHAPKTPMRMVVPHVLDLLAADRARLSMPRLRPPPGRYCAVDVVFDAPDEDALGLPQSPDMVREGLTAYFAGELATENANWDFEIPVGEDRSVRMPFVDDAGEPLEIRLDEDVRQARLTLRFGYGSACPHAAGTGALAEAGCTGLLDGIDFGTADDGGRQLRVMDNLLSNVRAEACAGAGCEALR